MSQRYSELDAHAKACKKYGGYAIRNSDTHGFKSSSTYEYGTGYYNPNIGFGKLWDSVKDWRNSCDWG